MGFFEDRSKEAYDRAAEAVQSGDPKPWQREMNDKRAKVAGSWGSKARAAKEGKLKYWKK